MCKQALSITQTFKHCASMLLLLAFIVMQTPAVAQNTTILNAEQLVAGAMDYWRSKTSYTEVTMTIHRPDWQRSMSLRAWTRGIKDSVIIFTEPKKDSGNATLKLDVGMWMFTPKLNQVIKLPASMMSQSWMGSDFSYNDLAKSDQIIDQFHHQLINTETLNDHTVYTIESIPKPDAAIVWGKEVLKIRDDHILLSEAFYDQDMKLVKVMETTSIGMLGNREFPLIMRITNMEEKDRWTELTNTSGYFDLSLPDYLFTQSNLRNPRHWITPDRSKP